MLPSRSKFRGKSFHKIQFSLLKVQFSSTAFSFPKNPRKSSSTAFQFLQRLSDFFNGFAFQETFFNGFPISSTAFRFPRNLLQRLYDNIIFQFRKLCVRTNRHSPHSLASDKDMNDEMAFQLNLYRQEIIMRRAWLGGSIKMRAPQTKQALIHKMQTEHRLRSLIHVGFQER